MANLVNLDPRDWSLDDLLAASILASTMAADTRFYTTHAQGMDKNAAEIVCDSLAQLAMNLSSEACRRAL